jgi:hypothetical protein
MEARFVREERYMHVTVDFGLDLAALKRVSLAFIQHPQFERGMNVLWDARDVPGVHLTFDDMREFGEFLAPLRLQRGGGRSAFVASQDILFGTFRIHQLLNEHKVSYNFQVFRDIDVAKAWLIEA